MSTMKVRLEVKKYKTAAQAQFDKDNKNPFDEGKAQDFVSIE
jgi:hypothetical protein